MNSFDIEKFLSLDDYADEDRKKRRKGRGGTQEFFTPYSLVKKMCDHISDEEWSNPESNFLDPCFGNGQFIIYIIYNRINHGVTWQQALEHIYGVELMEVNVLKTHERILDLFDKMNIDYDKDKALEILNHNLVCSDLFEWDFENWCSIKD